MKYKSVTVTRLGGPEVLQVTEHEMRPPAAGEVRIRVLAASVSRPDITVRTGEAFYSGTPLGQKVPFVPGYSVIGDVDAVGEGVTTVKPGDRVGTLNVVGGYTEYLYYKSGWLIPVPRALDPAEAVPLLLNYIVAYQILHRSARARPGECALIIGASGGIGTALLQIGKLAGLKLYGVASKSKHGVLCQYGAQPIDYHAQDFAQVIRQAEPEGVDVVFDGMMRLEGIRNGLSLLRHGGRMVSYGEPARGLRNLLDILGTVLVTNLLPNGKTYHLYGTSSYSLGNKRPFLEDWATLFQMLAEGKIKPLIEKKFPILEAAQANALLESGSVTGNVVLVAPELLQP